MKNIILKWGKQLFLSPLDSISFMAIMGAMFAVMSLIGAYIYYYYPLDFQRYLLLSLSNVTELIQYRYLLFTLIGLFFCYFSICYINRIRDIKMPFVFGIIPLFILILSLSIVLYHLYDLIQNSKLFPIIRYIYQPTINNLRGVNLPFILQKLLACEYPYYISIISYYFMITIAIFAPSRQPLPTITIFRRVQYYLAFLYISFSVVTTYYILRYTMLENPFSILRELQNPTIL